MFRLAVKFCSKGLYSKQKIYGDIYIHGLPVIDLQLKLTQVLRGKLTHLSGGVVSK